MKIGFDAKRFFYNSSGLGNYSRNIVSYLSEFYAENEYFLFKQNKKNSLSVRLSNNIKVIEPEQITYLKNNLYWRTKGVLKEPVFNKLDIYNGLSAELPIGIKKTRTKSILTVHDLIFVRFPELYKPIDRKIYLWKLKKSCREADKIIAISQQTKNDLIEFIGLSESNIDVVYQGCNEIYFSKKTKDEKDIIRKKYNLPENFILNVGTIEPRKKAKLIVEALNYGKIDFPLVIVGQRTDYVAEIKEYINKHKIQKQVIMLHNVQNSDLPTLYQSAEIFVYPSIFEGFGIPIIEAFNSETPVILSDTAIFKEVAEDAALYFEKNKHESLCEKIELLLNNKEERQKLILKAKKRADFFSGQNIAKSLIETYKSVL